VTGAQQRQQRLGDREGADQIDLELPTKIRQREVFDGSGRVDPALLTNPARPALPTAVCTWSAIAAIDASSVTSMYTGVSGPDASACSAAPSASLRTPAKTRNPLLSNRRAHARRCRSTLR
jgi:hypothetical protein